MKYTEKQKKQLKNKEMEGFTRYNRFIPDVKIINGFYVIESKMN